MSKSEEEEIDVTATKKSPLSAFADTIESNWDYVLNYFIGHNTNAIAESTKSFINKECLDLYTTLLSNCRHAY